jgi:kumamolisin
MRIPAMKKEISNRAGRRRNMQRRTRETVRSRVRVRGPVHVRGYSLKPSDDSTPGNSWNVPDLCAAYNWPSLMPGGGLIALVESAGGWLQSDLDQYFAGLGQPSPVVSDFSVDGTQNFHGAGPGEYDAEVALGIQVAAASYYAATGKPASIRIYWSHDIAAAVQFASADDCDVCSISWGQCEKYWGAPTTCAQMENAAQMATKAGMVIFAASGDKGSNDGGPDKDDVDCPASCPHIIGCGGTTKTKTVETVWNCNERGTGTGGGYSVEFTPLPTWQIGAPNGPGRMVPDISANADPNTGYNIILHGEATTRGGTSAVAWIYSPKTLV